MFGRGTPGDRGPIRGSDDLLVGRISTVASVYEEASIFLAESCYNLSLETAMISRDIVLSRYRELVEFYRIKLNG